MIPYYLLEDGKTTNSDLIIYILIDLLYIQIDEYTFYGFNFITDLIY